MFCVCLGNPVQISTCTIKLLHAFENSANFPLLVLMTSWAQNKLYIIWEQLRLSQTHKQGSVPVCELLSPLHLWLIFWSLTQEG